MAVAEAAKDWISLDLIISVANDTSDSDPTLTRLDLTLVLVQRLLARGFRAIDMEKGGGSNPGLTRTRASFASAYGK